MYRMRPRLRIPSWKGQGVGFPSWEGSGVGSSETYGVHGRKTMHIVWKFILRSGQCIGLSFLMIVLSGEVSAGAQEASPGGAIVTYITGEIMYQNESEQPEPSQVIAFMRMLQNDVLTLPAESEVRLLFLTTGHQETWKGEIVLKVEDIGCLVRQENVWLEQKPHKKKILMFQTEDRALKNPSIPLPNRGAVLIARAFPVLREVPEKKAADIKETHDDLQKRFGSDDATPEFYLLNAYAEYGQYAEMRSIIDTLLKKYPDNPILKHWEEWVKKREKTTKAPSE